MAESSSRSNLLPIGPENNVLAYLDATTRHGADFSGIIEFLCRSRIYRAISTECVPFRTHQQYFWDNAEIVDDKRNPLFIQSEILRHRIVISEDTLRQVLGFPDRKEDPVVLNIYLIKGCLLRIKYKGEISAGVIMKSGLSLQYKYLAHVISHCLSPRRSGHDQLSEIMTSAFVALILNLPFNFTGAIFKSLVENVTVKKDKYLMYSRFLQQVINDKLPDLPRDENDAIRLRHMNDITLGRLKAYRGMTEAEKPKFKRLIGHLSNPGYIAPRGLRWRHEESDSDVEDLEMLSASSDSEATQEATYEAVARTSQTEQTMNISLEFLGTTTEDPAEERDDVDDTFEEMFGGKRQRTEESADPTATTAPASTAAAAPRSISTPGKPKSKSLHISLANLDKKKRKFKMLSQAKASATTAPSSTQGVTPSSAPTSQPIPPPIFMTVTETPPITTQHTTTGVSDPQTKEALSTLSMMAVRLSNRNDQLTEKVKKLIEENQEMRALTVAQSSKIEELKRQRAKDEERMAAMQAELLEYRLMMVSSIAKHDKLEERVKVIEESLREDDEQLMLETAQEPQLEQPGSSSQQQEG